MVKVEWKGAAVAAAVKQLAIQLARDTAEAVKGESVDLAPLDESTLRNSATVNDIPMGAEISFNTPYAVVMHESENYTPSHPGTGPNYLRGPLLKAEGKYHRDLQALFK